MSYAAGGGINGKLCRRFESQVQRSSSTNCTVAGIVIKIGPTKKRHSADIARQADLHHTVTSYRDDQQPNSNQPPSNQSKLVYSPDGFGCDSIILG